MEKEVFSCQSCKAKLNITGTQAVLTPDANQASSRASRGVETARGSSRGDDSFIVLEPGAQKGKSFHNCMRTLKPNKQAPSFVLANVLFESELSCPVKLQVTPHTCRW